MPISNLDHRKVYLFEGHGGGGGAYFSARAGAHSMINSILLLANFELPLSQINVCFSNFLSILIRALFTIVSFTCSLVFPQ